MARGRYEHGFSDGRAILNLDEIWKAIYDQQRTALYVTCARLERVDTGFAGPSVETLEIDFAGAAAKAAKQADTIFAVLLRKIDEGSFTIESLRAQFKAYLGSAESARITLHSMMSNLAAKNGKAMASNEKMLGWGMSGLEFLRDGSTFTLAVGGTMLTGGAAVAFIAAGSAIGAAAKIQDSKATMTTREAFGKGVGVAAIDMTFGLLTFGLGGPLKAAGKVGKAAVTIIIDTMSNSMTGLLISEPDEDGKKPTPGDIAGNAYMKAVADTVVDTGLSYVLKKRAGSGFNQKLRRYLLPATIAITKANDGKVAGLVVKGTEKLIKKGVKTAGKKGLSEILAKGGDKTVVTGQMCTAPFFGGAEVLDKRVGLMITKLP